MMVGHYVKVGIQARQQFKELNDMGTTNYVYFHLLIYVNNSLSTST